MKHTLTLIVVCFLALGALYAQPPDIHRLIAPDSQMVVEINDFTLMKAVIAKAGLQEKLQQDLGKLMGDASGGKTTALSPAELDSIFRSQVIGALNVKFDTGGKPDIGMIAAIRLEDPAIFQRLRQRLEGKDLSRFKVTALGGYTIYTAAATGKKSTAVKKAGATDSGSTPEAKNETSAEKLVEKLEGQSFSFALGDQVIVVAVGMDVAHEVAAVLAGRPAFTWKPISAEVPVPATARSVFHARLATAEIAGVAKSALEKWAAAEKARQAEAAAKKKDDEQGGKKQGGEMNIPADSVVNFLEGLGLGSIEEVSVNLRQADDRMYSLFEARMNPEAAGMIPTYIRGINGHQVGVYKMLPADTAAFNDVALMDFPLFFQELLANVKTAFGPQGEGMVMQLEMMAQMKSGLSVREDILPLLGQEQGMALMNMAVKGGDGDVPPLPPAVFYFVPRQPELLDKVMTALEKTAGLVIKREPYREQTLYSVSLGKKDEKGPSIDAMLINGVVFVGMSSQLIHHVADELAAGNTIGDAPWMKPYLNRMRPDCVQFSISRMAEVRKILAGMPADSPVHAFLKMMGGASGGSGDYILAQNVYIGSAGLTGVGEAPTAAMVDSLSSLVKLVREKEKEKKEEQQKKEMQKKKPDSGKESGKKPAAEK